MQTQLEIAKSAIENVAWKRHQRAIDFHKLSGLSLFEAESRAAKMVAGDLQELLKTWIDSKNVTQFIQGLIKVFQS